MRKKKKLFVLQLLYSNKGLQYAHLNDDKNIVIYEKMWIAVIKTK